MSDERLDSLEEARREAESEVGAGSLEELLTVKKVDVPKKEKDVKPVEVRAEIFESKREVMEMKVDKTGLLILGTPIKVQMARFREAIIFDSLSESYFRDGSLRFAKYSCELVGDVVVMRKEGSDLVGIIPLSNCIEVHV